MKIGVIGSMQFTDKMLETREKLKEVGREGIVTDLHKAMIGKDKDKIEETKIYQFFNFYQKIKR